jgi:hypothetical protein
MHLRRSRVILAASLAAAAICLTGCGATVHDTKDVPLSLGPATAPPTIPHAARKDINRTLDAFVRYGVERTAPAKAYALASPMMLSGVTRHEWMSGSLPVPPFRSKGTNFHRYSVMAVDGNKVYLSMILQARHPKVQGAVAYNIRLTRQHGRWLVDWFTPSAFFAAKNQKPKLFAAPDIAPSADANWLQQKSGANLVMTGVLLVLGLPLLAVIGWVVVNAVRGRMRRPAPLPEDDRWDAALRRTGAGPRS